MKIFVYHHTTKGKTGTNEFLLSFIRTLHRLSYEIDLLVFGEADKQLISELMKYSKVKYAHMPFLTRTLSLLIKPLIGLLIELIVVRKSRYSKSYFLVISTNTIITPIYPHIAYIHYPSFHPSSLDEQDVVFSYRSPLMNAFYRTLYKFYLKVLTSIINLLFGKHMKEVLYLTNSSYVQRIIRKYCLKNAIVLYPPINVRGYRNVCSDNFEKMPIVVTISRLAYEKRLHIIPILAKITEQPISFVIIGWAKGRMGQEVRKLIDELSKKLGVNEKVKLLINTDEDAKIRILCSSKIYLHTMLREHFGISVVEAMAFGVPVIVPVHGGPYEDIIECGKYGLAYSSLKEAAKLIDIVLYNEDIWKKFSTLSQLRAWMYDISMFECRLSTILKVISKYYELK